MNKKKTFCVGDGSIEITNVIDCPKTCFQKVGSNVYHQFPGRVVEYTSRDSVIVCKRWVNNIVVDI